MSGDQDKYTYEDAGYNGFFRRSIGSRSTDNNLSGMGTRMGSINFDSMQVSGSMGDIFTIGKIQLNGRDERISIFNDNGDENTRLGELDG